MLGSREVVDAVLTDHRTAPITGAEHALFRFIEKVNAESNQIQQDDIDAMKRAGWNEEAIYDAISVCALFRFYNTWIDATGVSDMPAASYAASGERMAAHGYV